MTSALIVAGVVVALIAVALVRGSRPEPTDTLSESWRTDQLRMRR
jgi:hypothetical protein